MQNGGVNFTSYDNVNQFLVSLNGVLQAPTDSFTVSGSTLTFASNLSTGDVIDFVLVLGNSLDIGTPSDNTVTTTKLSGALVTPSTLDVNGNELILDADGDTSITADTDDQIDFKTGGTDRASIDSSGNLQFNSGYGSVETAYGVRAWVRFNGSGTLSIQGSGNVTSITDNATGDYTINFTNNMPDTNYIYITSACDASNARGTLTVADIKTVSALQLDAVRFTTSVAVVDFNDCNVAILR
jgi:hypothetical protein